MEIRSLPPELLRKFNFVSTHYEDNFRSLKSEDCTRGKSTGRCYNVYLEKIPDQIQAVINITIKTPYFKNALVKEGAEVRVKMWAKKQDQPLAASMVYLVREAASIAFDEFELYFDF